MPRQLGMWVVVGLRDDVVSTPTYQDTQGRPMRRGTTSSALGHVSQILEVGGLRVSEYEVWNVELNMLALFAVTFGR